MRLHWLPSRSSPLVPQRGDCSSQRAAAPVGITIEDTLAVVHSSCQILNLFLPVPRTDHSGATLSGRRPQCTSAAAQHRGTPACTCTRCAEHKPAVPLHLRRFMRDGALCQSVQAAGFLRITCQSLRTAQAPVTFPLQAQPGCYAVAHRPRLSAGFCAQQSEASAASWGGTASSHSGRTPLQHTAAAICASSSPSCARSPCHISHTACRITYV